MFRLHLKTKHSARSVESDAAAGSHQSSLPLWGRWHRVADTMTEGVVRPGADGVVLLCRQRCAAVGFPPHPPSRFYVVVTPEIRGATAPVSPAGSVGASACGRGCHRQPAPRLRGSQGRFGFQNALAKGKTSLPSPKAERLRVAGGDLCAKRRSNDRAGRREWQPEGLTGEV